MGRPNSDPVIRWLLDHDPRAKGNHDAYLREAGILSTNAKHAIARHERTFSELGWTAEGEPEPR